MANVTKDPRTRGAMIAGPRRARAVPPPLPTPSRAMPPPLPRASDAMALDYDEPTQRRSTSPALPSVSIAPDPAPAPSPRTETTAKTRRETRGSARWFVLGVVLGIVGITVARGDAVASLKSARSWGANALRSLKSSAPANAPANASPATSSAEPRPCSLTDDDCAVLMAPFLRAEAEAAAKQASIPVVAVSDLPKVKPPVVYVAPPPRVLDIASPVAQPDEPAPAVTADPTPAPAKRLPGPFDAPGPIEPRGMVATTTP